MRLPSTAHSCACLYARTPQVFFIPDHLRRLCNYTSYAVIVEILVDFGSLFFAFSRTGLAVASSVIHALLVLVCALEFVGLLRLNPAVLVLGGILAAGMPVVFAIIVILTVTLTRGGSPAEAVLVLMFISLLVDFVAGVLALAAAWQLLAYARACAAEDALVAGGGGDATPSELLLLRQLRAAGHAGGEAAAGAATVPAAISALDAVHPGSDGANASAVSINSSCGAPGGDLPLAAVAPSDADSASAAAGAEASWDARRRGEQTIFVGGGYVLPPNAGLLAQPPAPPAIAACGTAAATPALYTGAAALPAAVAAPRVPNAHDIYAVTTVAVAAAPPAPPRDDCDVCAARRRDTAFVPCGHLLCSACAATIRTQMGRCHICRKAIRDTLIVYI